MMFRLVMALCLLFLAGAGGVWGWQAWQARAAYAPAADFLIDGSGDGLVVTLFTDYRCGNCSAFYKAVDDLRALHPDLRFAVRPMIFIDTESEKMTRLALAAGLKGHFWEIHAALLERRGHKADETFWHESAALYGLDYDEWIALSEGETIDALIEDNNKDAGAMGVDVVPSVVIGKVYYKFEGDIARIAVGDLLPVLAQAQQTR